MKQINLIPADTAVREVSQRTNFFMVVAVLLAVAATLVPWWTLRVVSSNVETDANAKAAAFAAGDTGESAGEAQRQLADLQRRTEAINQLTATEIDWLSVYRLLEDNTPQDITMTNVSAAGVSGEFVVRMTGTAPSNVSFVSFVDVLKQEAAFSKLVVDGFVYNPADGSVTFTVSVTIKAESIRYALKEKL